MTARAEPRPTNTSGRPDDWADDAGARKAKRRRLAAAASSRRDNWRRARMRFTPLTAVSQCSTEHCLHPAPMLTPVSDRWTRLAAPTAGLGHDEGDVVG